MVAIAIRGLHTAVENAWSGYRRCITVLHQTGRIGERVLLAVPAEVLGRLQAAYPVLVMAEALPAWHPRDWRVLRPCHDLWALLEPVLHAIDHVPVRAVEDAASCVAIRAGPRVALVWQACLLGLGCGDIGRLLGVLPHTCDCSHWLLLAQLLEPRQPILGEALASIAAKGVFLARAGALLGRDYSTSCCLMLSHLIYIYCGAGLGSYSPRNPAITSLDLQRLKVMGVTGMRTTLITGGNKTSRLIRAQSHLIQLSAFHAAISLVMLTLLLLARYRSATATSAAVCTARSDRIHWILDLSIGALVKHSLLVHSRPGR